MRNDKRRSKKKAKVMMAFADGKMVEQKCKYGNSQWETISDNTCSFCWEDLDYRIKSEPIYRPFKNKEECWNEMQKHQPFGWIKTGGSFLNIIEIYDTRALIGDTKGMVYWKYIFNDYQFADGTPFGTKEE